MTDFASVLKNIRTNDGFAFHAFLLENAKIDDALSLAQAFLCENKDETLCGCSVCGKLKNNSHPDVKVYDGAGEKGLSIDVIRQVSADLYVKPNESARKIYILLNVDLMTIQAANALLKSLEEPPVYGVFVLTTSSRFKLPDTVRSRCAFISLAQDTGTETDFSEVSLQAISCIEKRDELGLFTVLSTIKSRDEFTKIIYDLREIFAKNIRANNLNVSLNATTRLFDVLGEVEKYFKSNMQIRLLAATISTKILNELRS